MLNFIDQYVDRALPHVVTARDAAQAYAERIISHLEEIRAAVQTEDYQERRQGLENPHARNNGVLEIERDQTWILEHVALDAAGTVTIRENGRLRFAKTFTAPDSAGGNNLVFRGGSTVEFAVTAGNLYVQARVSQLRPERHLTAVFPLADVTPNGAGSPFSAAGRHAPGDITIRHNLGDAAESARSG